MQIENLVGTSLTMTSLEIAGLTGKRHDNVTVDIRKRLTELQGAEGVLSFQGTHTNPQSGRAYRAISAKGREFGYSLSNEHSKGSVQPVWFEPKFGELLNIIK
jgi:hypothetical protein